MTGGASVSIGRNPGFAGVTYFLMPVLHPAYGIWVGVRSQKIHDELEGDAAALR